VDSWQPAYIGVGSNLGDPRHQVQDALGRLGQLPGTRLILKSGMYASKPFGPIAQPDYVNAVAALLTQLTPKQLLRELRRIEYTMGRPEQHERWGPRVIDLDLLSYGREHSVDPELTLPHPGIVERNFVLYPLAEITPDLEIPGLGRVAQLAGRIGSDGLHALSP
jgi:2-amino-4-hydroxy-6-hydroxymethyldihydropteridine diphosphokinase